MKHPNYLVIGASGAVGSEVVKNIVQQGFSVRGTTSKKSSLLGPVSYISANLQTGDGVREAFEGVDRAFIMSPAGYADQHSILSPLIQEAKRGGLKKVVLLSAYGADANDSAPLRKAELELERSGLSYNVIRPNWFFQNFNTYWLQGIRDQGKILLPVKDAKVSFIDARDIGKVAAKLLTTDDQSNQSFNLTGAEAISHSEVAEAISKVTGKQITYKEITPEAMRQGLLGAGLNPAYTDFLLMILGYVAEGYNTEVNQNIKMLTGSEPTRLTKYVEDYRQSWL